MSLVLDSLEIKNFRAFKHLRIEKLGRVNLIVGKNNVGKSSVLEALWLYTAKGDPRVVVQLLRERDELKVDDDVRSASVFASNNLTALRHLFHGRRELSSSSEHIVIGPKSVEDDKVAIGFALSERVLSGNGTRILQRTESDAELSGAELVASMTVDLGEKMHMLYPLDQLYTDSNPMFRPARVMRTIVHSVIIAHDGLTAKDVALYWDNTIRADLQHDVVAALQIIAPGTISINFVSDTSNGGERIPIIKTQDFVLPIPLRSMGEGMNRMLGIALALVNAKDGMLLIDEVDTGLHYSVLPDLWKLIFEVAHRLNVQVFATSHSWDCIQAFQQASEENKEEEGVLIRLETQDGEVVPVTFDERKLSIATREQIEVR